MMTTLRGTDSPSPNPEKGNVLQSYSPSYGSYRMILDGMNEAFCRMEIVRDKDQVPRDFVFLEVNRAYENQWELKAGDILGKRASELNLLPEADTLASLGRVEQTGEPLCSEEQNKKTNKHYETRCFRIARNQIGTFSREMIQPRKDEEAPRSSEEMFRAFFDYSPVDTALMDIDGKFLYVNEAWLRMHGISSKSEVLGKPCFSLIDEAYVEKAQEKFAEVLKTGLVENVELVLKRTNGQKIDVFLSATALHNVAGRAVTVLAMVQDVTQAKSLRTKYSKILETMMNGFWISNVQGKFLEVNSAYCRMSGYTREELLKMSISGIEAIERREDVIQHMVKLQSSGFDHFLSSHKRKDGSAFDVEINATFLDFDDGLVVTFVQDVSEARKAERALRESEAKFRSVFEAANVGKSLTLPSGEVNFNDAFCQMLGFAQNELKGKKWQDFTPPEEVESVQNILDSLLRGEKDSARFTKRYIHREGSFVWGDVSTSLQRDTSGKPLYFITNVIDITERKKTEEMLRQSQRKYQDLTETTSDFIWEMDSAGKYTYCSPQMKRLWGLEPAEMIGKTPFDIMPPDMRERGIAFFSSMANSPKAFNGLEMTSYDSQGRLAFLEVNGVPFFDDRNRLLGYRGITRDITERKKSEATLRETEVSKAESFYARSLIEASLDPLVTIDADGKITDVNKAAEQVTGRSRAELIGTDFSNYFTEPEKARTGFTQVFSEGFVRDYALSIRSKSGDVKEVLYNASVFKNEAGEAQGVFAAARDVTQRRLIERELANYQKQLEHLVAERTKEARESRDYLDNLLNHANAPIIVWDLELKITKFNHAFEQLTGHEAQDVMGKDLGLLFPESKQKEAMNHIQSTVVGEHWESVEIPILTKSGTTRTVLWNSANINDHDGQRIATIAQGVDVTDRKKTEERLREAERFAAIGKTAAMIGHDLRNPLQAIVGSISVVEEKLKTISAPGEEKQVLEESLEGLSELVFYMDKIVSDLQDYARPVKTFQASTDLHQLLKEALSLSNIPPVVFVSTKIPKNFPRMRLDPSIMKRVLTNLMMNAVQAMPNGGTLTIKASRKKDPRMIVITVEDTGIGIAKADRARIFTPLFTTKSKGQGFGLAVCKRLVEAHGGTITFKSKVNQGTRFTIKLPVPEKEKIHLDDDD